MSTIETPMINDSITNQQATQKNSLYHTCRYVLNALSTIDELKSYLSIPDHIASTPMTKLWHFCRQGITLCLLFNTLQSKSPIPLDHQVMKNKPKAYVYHFILACRNQLSFPQDTLFTLTDLFQDDTNGFVRVVNIIKKILELLESKGIIEIPIMDNHLDPNAPKDTRDKIVVELLETERKYVQDLETLQNYMNHAQMNEVLPPDTLHQLFGNLNSLVDFQRRFLNQVEAQADKIPMEQRFGLLFEQFEDAFKVYEPFCANFQTAQDIIVSEVQALEPLSHILSANFELPSMLIKPVQRICKYPLLMKELVKSTPTQWTYYHETEAGLNAILRVASKVNETKRKQENHALVQDLKKRVYDWSITDIDDYGALLLHDKFMIYRGQPGRELTVYLFEDCLFVCREEKMPLASSSGSGSSSVDQNKDTTTTTNNNNNNNGNQKKKNKKKESNASQLDTSAAMDYRLNVRGRILISRIAQVVDASKDGIWNLQIYWSNKTNHAKENNNNNHHPYQQNYGIESFTLKCRHQEQLQLWESTLSTLLKQIKQKAREAKAALLLSAAAMTSSSSSSTTITTTPSTPSLISSHHSSPSEHGSYTVPTTPTHAYGLLLPDHLEHKFIHPSEENMGKKNRVGREKGVDDNDDDDVDEEENDDDDDDPLYTFTSLSYHAHLNQYDNTNDSLHSDNNTNMNNNGCRLSFYNTTPGMSLPPLPRDSPSHPYNHNDTNHNHEEDDHYQSVPATELVTQHMLNEYEAEGYEDSFDTYFSMTSPSSSTTQLSYLSQSHVMDKPLPSLSNQHYHPHHHHHHHNINNPTRLRSQSSPNIHQPLKTYQHEKVTTTPSLPPISTNSVYHHYHTLYASSSSSTTKNDNQHHHSHQQSSQLHYHPSDYYDITSKQDKRKSNGDQDLRRPLYSFDNHHYHHQQQQLLSNEDYYNYYCQSTPTHQNNNENDNNNNSKSISPTAIKVKVHHSGSIYVLVVPLSVDYKELVERIEKKMKCDSSNNNNNNNNNNHSDQKEQDIVLNGLKYQDEDGDLITIGSNDDLQMGFELRGLNNTVNFYIV